MTLRIGPSTAIAGSRHYKWWVYAAVGIGLLMSIMDQSGINIALPKIADHFNVDIPTVQWITLSYMLSTSAMFMPIGRLSDMIGRKRIFLTGLLIFMGAAAVGGASPVFPLMIVAKIVQGIGAAGIQANGMAMIIEAFPEREWGKALGQYITIIGLGIIAGPVIGGLLVSEFGWRLVFFANIPVGLIALVSVLAVVKGEGGIPGKGTRRFSFDWAGAGLSSGALVCFLLGMANAHRFGWSSPPIIVSLLITAALLTAFIWWELHTSDPILDLSFFRNKLFSTGIAARLLFFLALSSVFFLMPFYLIKGLNYEPKIAGLFILPSAASLTIMGPISGRLSDSFGARWVTVAGLAVSASTMFTLSRLNLDSSPAHVVAGMILNGLGDGFFTTANTSAIISTQGRGRYSIASAFVNLTTYTGLVTGIALATTIVTVTMASMGYEPSLGAVSEVGSEGVRAAFVSGLSKAFLISDGIMLLAMVVSGLQGRARQSEPSFRGSIQEPSPLPNSAGDD